MFKEYKECEKDKSEARNLYKILDNEYMVCVGYAKLLSDLLSKLNINNTTLGITIDVSYENEKVDIIACNVLLLFQLYGYSYRCSCGFCDDSTFLI